MCKVTLMQRVRSLHLLDVHLNRSCVDYIDSSFIAETSFVRAPLNSRVVSSSAAIPKISQSKGKEKQETLDRVPLEVQQALILEDLLFVLMVRFGLSYWWPFLRTCLIERAPKVYTLRFLQITSPRRRIRCKESSLSFLLLWVCPILNFSFLLLKALQIHHLATLLNACCHLEHTTRPSRHSLNKEAHWNLAL